MSVWDTCLQITVVCTVIGAWVGAFPIPLDWDRPWQVSTHTAVSEDTLMCLCVCVCHDTLWLWILTGLAFCRFGLFPAAWVLWLVSWLGLSPLLPGSTIIASILHTSASDGQICVCLPVNVTVRVLSVFQLSSSNYIFLFIVDIYSVCHLWDRLFCINTRLNKKKSYLDTERVLEDFFFFYRNKASLLLQCAFSFRFYSASVTCYWSDDL